MNSVFTFLALPTTIGKESIAFQKKLRYPNFQFSIRFEFSWVQKNGFYFPCPTYLPYLPQFSVFYTFWGLLSPKRRFLDIGLCVCVCMSVYTITQFLINGLTWNFKLKVLRPWGPDPKKFNKIQLKMAEKMADNMSKMVFFTVFSKTALTIFFKFIL